MSVDPRQLANLLLHPKEDLEREYKNWLDLDTNEGKADLAKAMIALANHGGGYVVLGYEDDNGNQIPDSNRPASLERYSQDLINGIVIRYADPVFHCQVLEVNHPESAEVYPIILVPGGHKIPIRTRRGGPGGQYFDQNEYLIRRPGPRSERPQSSQEWNEFILRCVRNNREELYDSIRAIILGVTPVQSVEDDVNVTLSEWISESLTRFDELVAEKLSDEKPSRYASGKWYLGYQVHGDIDRPSLAELNNIIRDIQGNETGWPAWLTGISHSMPFPHQGVIDCIILSERFRDGAHSDVWRASPDGTMFLLRGYQEDGSTESHESGTFFDFILPIWNVGECVLHSKRFVEHVSEIPRDITLQVTYDSLLNRTLKSWAEPRYFIRGNVCHTPGITSTLTYNSEQVDENLPEIVNEILKPLYEAFDFFTLPSEILIHELKRLRRQT